MQRRRPILVRSLEVVRPRIRGDFFWSPVEEATIARYVHPGDPAVESVLDQMRADRGSGFGPDEHPERVAEYVYEWLRRNRNIVYEYELVRPHRPVSQQVRMHRETLERGGTCIDLATLYCALLEGAHQRPVLVHYQGHMVCGLWLQPNDSYSYDWPLCREATALQTLLKENNLLLIECIGFAKGYCAGLPVNCSFDLATKHAADDALDRRVKVSTSHSISSGADGSTFSRFNKIVRRWALLFLRSALGPGRRPHSSPETRIGLVAGPSPATSSPD